MKSSSSALRGNQSPCPNLIWRLHFPQICPQHQRRNLLLTDLSASELVTQTYRYHHTTTPTKLDNVQSCPLRQKVWVGWGAKFICGFELALRIPRVWWVWESDCIIQPTDARGLSSRVLGDGKLSIRDQFRKTFDMIRPSHSSRPITFHLFLPIM